jgi:hypothetical protein
VDSERVAEEVMSGGDVKASPRHSETSPRGLKAQEGIERSAGLNRLLAATDRCLDECPEGDPSGSGSGGATRREEMLGNDTRARLADEASRLDSGESPWSANPGRGSGMKQAHEVCGGANRREREKRCGRNVVGCGNPGVEWTPHAGVAKGTETLEEAPRAFTGDGQVKSSCVL